MASRTASQKHTSPRLKLLLLTVVVATIGSFNFYLPVKQMERGEWVSLARRIIDQLETFDSHIVLFDQNQPPPADPARHMRMDFDRIEKMIVDPGMKQRMVELRQLFDQGATAGQVHGHLQTMLAAEQQLLQERTVRWKEAAWRSRIILASSTLLIYLSIVLVYRAMHKQSQTRQLLLESERGAADTQRELSKRLSQVVEIQREIALERLNLESVMAVITERTQTLMNADCGIVEQLDGDYMVYRAASGTGIPFIGTRIKAAGSLSGLCIEQKKTLHCRDSETDPRVDREACRKVGLRSMLVVPLLHKGQASGVLKIASAKPDAFNDEQAATLEMMATLLSATLRDAQTSDAINTANLMLSDANAMLEAQKVELESLATTDGLTGLKNNRFFKERLAEEYSRAMRYQSPLSLLLFDVDHFKQYNDTFGHPAGDAVLKDVAALMKKTARLTDCVARYGGEEFAIILPQTDGPGAMIIADRLRQIIAEAPWDKRLITASVGVSTLNPEISDSLQLVQHADNALYLSKAAGRNTVTHSDDACMVPRHKHA